jgi:chromate transport protein ChrA
VAERGRVRRRAGDRRRLSRATRLSAGGVLRLHPPRRGRGLAAAAGFALAPYLLVTAAAWCYVRLADSWQIRALFYGIAPVVVSLILKACWNLGRKTLTVLATPLLLRYGRNRRLRGFIRGITVTVVGVLVGTTFLVGKTAITDWPTAGVAVLTLAALAVWQRLPEPLVVALGGALGLAAHWLHLV